MGKVNKQEDSDNENHSDVKQMTDVEYLEYMKKKTRTVNTIIYPDGSKGEINIGAVILL